MLRTRFRTRARFIPALSGGGGFSITNSLRFNDNDSAYLSRTPSVAGDRKTWTWSGWVKRGNLASPGFYVLFGGRNGSTTPYGLFYFYDDEIRFLDSLSGMVSSSAKLRDASGWYHLICVVDTTQATASDRVKIYVNGEQITSFSTATYPSLNQDLTVNTTYPHAVGAQPQITDFFDGYMAEVNFIDGQALTPDDFGQIDASTGEWSPKKYSGTYGTNGFYLEFKDSAALGDDTSGNTNDWTPTNLASTDQMLDTPTNNFCTLNPLDKGSSLQLLEGNLKWYNSSLYQNGRASFGMTSGKWYCEYVILTQGTSSRTGGGLIASQDVKTTYQGNTPNSYYKAPNGRVYYEETLTAITTTYTTGDIIGMAYDADTGTIKWYKNGVHLSADDRTVTSTDYIWHFGWHAYNSSDSGVYNFGQDSSFAGNKTRQGNTDANGIGDFYYTPPAGYIALCTDNLPAPAIEQPETQFNVVLDTGANIKATAEALYDSSLIWIKDRANSNNHQLIDTVRGTGVLQSNTTAAETTYSAPSGNSVAWVWKAGGTAVTNTDGSITSQVSANVDAGFSVATYTGNSSTGTIGHGLSKKPELVIIKNRGSSAPGWYVGSPSFGTNNYLLLNSTSAMLNYVDGSGGAFFNYGGWSDSVVNVYNANSTSINSSSYSYVMYSFHSVEGFSKIGTYIGNGSTNGPFVYTGFKPAFVLVKRTDTTSGWLMVDNERSGYNGKNDIIFSENSAAEYSGATYPRLDLLSNGFKVIDTATGVNASGGTYIYMAFAEHPFKEALAR